jgi:hypothetical protein
MSISDLAQLLTGIGLLMNGTVTVLSYLQSVRNGKTLDAVHEATNSMKDALVESTAKENFAAGVTQGVQNPAAPRGPRADGV